MKVFRWKQLKGHLFDFVPDIQRIH